MSFDDTINRSGIAYVNSTPFGLEGVLDILLKDSPGAVMVHPSERPSREDLNILSQAHGKEIPVIVLAGSLRDTSPYENAHAVTIPVAPLHAHGVLRGLDKLIQTIGANGNPSFEALRGAAKDMFDRPDFYDKPEFIDMLIDPELRKLGDSLPKSASSVVVDCGHIDSRKYLPTDGDLMAMEEGILLFKYLKMKGHGAKLGNLFNEMYLLNIHQSNADARKEIDHYRKQVKHSGIHTLLLNSYSQMLDGHGINPKRDMMCTFEGSLNLENRQDLQAAATGQSPYQVGLTQVGRGFEYSIAGTSEDRQISSPERGAPFCNLTSAKLDQRYEKKGVRTVIYLRDTQWECAVRQGHPTARELFGATIQAYLVPFVQDGNRITAMPVQKL